MKILHIIRDPNDVTAIEIATSQSKDHEVAVLLMHDGVYASPGLTVYAVSDDARARGVAKHELVEYDRIVEMIFEYDKVISW